MRKISTIFVSLLLIFTIRSTSVQAGVAFTAVDTIIGWGSTFYSLQDSITDKTSENVERILQTVNKSKRELTNLGHRLSAQMDTMLKTLLNDIETTTELQGLKSRLLPYLHKIDHYYRNSFKYIPSKSYANSTLEKFTERVLFGTYDLMSILDGIRDVFIPGAYVNLNAGYVPLFIKKTTQNLPTDCQRSISPQQIMYYIYVQLIIAEMKALVIFKNVYETKSWLEDFRTIYKAELEDAQMNFEEGVRSYYKIFAEQLSMLPRHLRRCHVNAPKRGVDYIELEGLSTIKFLTPDFIVSPECFKCPNSDQITSMERSTQKHIYNCAKMGTKVTVCPADFRSPHHYLWWKDEDGTHYGADETCPYNTMTVSGNTRTTMGRMTEGIVFSCNLCYCSVDENTKERKSMKSWRISIMPQISDIRNNMVVTGVQFIVRHKTIHLRIQQGKLLKNGMVSSNTTWKNVNEKYYNNSQVLISHLADGRIGATEKTINLDDVTVPKGSVVTGVQFERHRNTSNFILWVHATEFDITTGQLNPSSSFLCSRNVCVNKSPIGDYVRKRVDIDMGKADNPTRGAEFHYDVETNKMVTFKHTDVHKDGGQTTIPFFDAQPLQARPAFPLSGIGLYYRGREGFGGYIAPRIFTLDVTQYMESPKIDLNEEQITTTTEKVEWVVQDFEGQKYEPDKYFEYHVDKK